MGCFIPASALLIDLLLAQNGKRDLSSLQYKYDGVGDVNSNVFKLGEGDSFTVGSETNVEKIKIEIKVEVLDSGSKNDVKRSSFHTLPHGGKSSKLLNLSSVNPTYFCEERCQSKKFKVQSSGEDHGQREPIRGPDNLKARVGKTNRGRSRGGRNRSVKADTRTSRPSAVKMIKCDHCGKRFSANVNKSVLVDHIQSTHMPKPSH